MKDKSLHERYQRQILLKEFGIAGQQKLLQAKVLVIGAGGLGCPVLQYLTAAGTGSIGIVDDDVVSISNLHRQVLFDMKDIGKPKVSAAVAKLRLMNPDTEFVEYQIHLDKNNCLEIISGYDIIVDCTDNFASRYMINDACVLKGKTLVYAAVNRFEGQVAVFNVNKEGKESTGNYRDLFPVQPAQSEVLNCAEAGVLGVLPGIIGSMQANEVIKLITGMGEPLVNQLLTYHALDNRTFTFSYNNNLSSRKKPESEKDFLEMNYEDACINDNFLTIDALRFDELILQNDVTVIDVRELHELPLVTEFKTIRIPLSILKNKINDLAENNIIFFCQSGSRSLQAATMAAEHFGDNSRFFCLKEGIVAWKKLREKQLI